MPVFLSKILLFTLILSSGISACLAQEGKSLPNIIIVLADDLGYGDLSISGNQLIATPHLDRMAREGVRLTSFYASANVCTPSRAGLYGDVVETLDWSMGQLFAVLKRLDLDDHTLVIFTSDNGAWFEGSGPGSHLPPDPGNRARHHQLVEQVAN